MGVQTAVALLLIAAAGYSAWLTSIVFCAANGRWPLVVAAASFFRSVLCMVWVSGSADGDTARRRSSCGKDGSGRIARSKLVQLGRITVLV
jgi:hypothetical protein